MLKNVKLKELGEIFTGSTPSKKNKEFYNSEDIMFIKPDILDFDIVNIGVSNEYISEKAREKARIIPANSLLVSCIGSIGKLGINEKEVAFNQQINAIVPNNKIKSSRYLAYLLKYNQKKLESIANAPVVPIINKTQFSEFEVLIHENLNFQEQITQILDKSKEIIEKRKEQIQFLDKLVKSKFIEMFGDPFNDEKGYGIKKLGEVTEVNPKKSEIKELDKDLIVSFVPMDRVSEKGEFAPELSKPISEVYNGFTYFKDNDVLFAKITPCMENGKGAIAINLSNGIGFGSTEFHVLRPIKDNSNPYWIYHLTTLIEFRRLAERKMTGSAGQKRVPTDFLNNVEVVIPPIELQNQFADFAKQVDKLKFILHLV
ncbi:restriction endonuclease subunit S [Clostridium perfringens]|nr:restriction endonuclease subunit S [Clostridium perfringens]MDZ4936449.1 restriction endonuclease subunit S [Clostridium perfringens]